MGLKRWEVFTPPLLSASLAWPLGSVCRPGRPFTAPVITVTVWVHYEQECLNHTGAATKAPAEHCPQYSCTSHCKHSHASQSSLKRRGYSAQFGVYSLSLSHSLNLSHSRSPSLHSRAVLGSRLYTRSPGFPNMNFWMRDREKGCWRVSRVFLFLLLSILREKSQHTAVHLHAFVLLVFLETYNTMWTWPIRQSGVVTMSLSDGNAPWGGMPARDGLSPPERLRQKPYTCFPMPQDGSGKPKA